MYTYIYCPQESVASIKTQDGDTSIPLTDCSTSISLNIPHPELTPPSLLTSHHHEQPLTPQPSRPMTPQPIEVVLPYEDYCSSYELDDCSSTGVVTPEPSRTGPINSDSDCSCSDRVRPRYDQAAPLLSSPGYSADTSQFRSTKQAPPTPTSTTPTKDRNTVSGSAQSLHQAEVASIIADLDLDLGAGHRHLVEKTAHYLYKQYNAAVGKAPASYPSTSSSFSLRSTDGAATPAVEPATGDDLDYLDDAIINWDREVSGQQYVNTATPTPCVMQPTQDSGQQRVEHDVVMTATTTDHQGDIATRVTEPVVTEQVVGEDIKPDVSLMDIARGASDGRTLSERMYTSPVDDRVLSEDGGAVANGGTPCRSAANLHTSSMVQASKSDPLLYKSPTFVRPLYRPQPDQMMSSPLDHKADLFLSTTPTSAVSTNRNARLEKRVLTSTDYSPLKAEINVTPIVTSTSNATPTVEAGRTNDAVSPCAPDDHNGRTCGILFKMFVYPSNQSNEVTVLL